MNVTLQITFTVIIITILAFIMQYMKRRKQPPGPLGLPFFGDQPLIVLKFFFPNLFPKVPNNKYCMEMKKKYGDIWSVNFGNKNIVVLSSPHQLKKAFLDNGEVFSGKSNAKYFRIFGNGRGFGFSNEKFRKYNRYMAIKSLREFGRELEHQSCQVADELIESIRAHSTSSFSSPTIFEKPISNIIIHMLFNIRYGPQDEHLDKFTSNLKKILHYGNACQVLDLFSDVIPMFLLKRMFSCIDEFLHSLIECRAIVKKLCLERLKVQKEFSDPNCIFDYFWQHQFKEIHEISFDEKMSEIVQSLFEIFIGGSDTTTLMLSFCCLILGKRQHIQEDLRQELTLIFGDHNHFGMQMRNNCPKMLSFIDEVSRFCILIPRLERKAMSDCLLDNYKISFNDRILGDMNTVCRSPDFFENPNEFDAYRFLDSTKTKYVKNNFLTVFGLGKRSCIGEGMANIKLFIMLAKLILNFQISLPKNTDLNFDVILEGTDGFLHSPINHEVHFDKI